MIFCQRIACAFFAEEMLGAELTIFDTVGIADACHVSLVELLYRVDTIRIKVRSSHALDRLDVFASRTVVPAGTFPRLAHR